MSPPVLRYTPRRQSLSQLITVVSPAINIFLVLILIRVVSFSRLMQQVPPSTVKESVLYKSWPNWLTNITPNLNDYDAERLDSLVTFRGQLSHVLFVMRETDQEMEDLSVSLDFWRRYPPCLADSYPTNHSSSEIDLVFYFDASPSPIALKNIKEKLQSLPASVQSCFRNVELRHAGMEHTMNATAQEEREQWRQVFETLVTNRAGLSAPNHVLILCTECRPVQPDWLNHIDYTIRPPVESAWMRGSIFHGKIEDPPHDIGQLIRLSSSGLYNFGDGAFAAFYLTRVRPWTMKTQSPIIPEFGDRWSVDIFQYLTQYDVSLDWFSVTHQFHHVDFIVDYHGTKVPLEKFQLYNPDTFIVCGQLV